MSLELSASVKRDVDTLWVWIEPGDDPRAARLADEAYAMLRTTVGMEGVRYPPFHGGTYWLVSAVAQNPQRLADAMCSFLSARRCHVKAPESAEHSRGAILQRIREHRTNLRSVRIRER